MAASVFIYCASLSCAVLAAFAAGDMDSSRFYQADKPGSRELYDDVAWYEGRYPSQLAPPGQQQKRGPARSAALAVTDTGEGRPHTSNRASLAPGYVDSQHI